MDAILLLLPNDLESQRSEKPPVLSTRVAALKNLLDILLGIFALGHLLECVCRDAALEALEFESVASGHEVAVVDGFDEWPELASLCLPGLVQAASHLARVSRNADDEGMAVWMRLVTRVDGLDNDNLFAGMSAAGDDGYSADLEELHCHNRTWSVMEFVTLMAGC